MGFADSKALTATRREQLLEALQSRPYTLEWSVRLMSPADISAGMTRRSPYNLNAQSFDATCILIRQALTQRYNLRHIYVDTVGPPAAYSAKLSAAFPGVAFTVCSKADSIYPIVGAASIAAKVTRDAALEAWVYPEEAAQARPPKRRPEDAEGPRKRTKAATTTWSRELGSGYPSDPNTVAWLEAHFDPIFGFPAIARFSWGTVKHLFEGKGRSCRWDDEPKSIQKWFSEADKAKEEQLAGGALKGAWKETGLRSVTAL